MDRFRFVEIEFQREHIKMGLDSIGCLERVMAEYLKIINKYKYKLKLIIEHQCKITLL
jgi:hypothetical protein